MSAAVPVGLTLSPEELEPLDREAAARGMKRATLVRGILRARYGLPSPVEATASTWERKPGEEVPR